MNKKSLIAILIILVLVVIAIVFSKILSNKKQKDRDYELLSVTNYTYFPLEVNGKYGVIKRDGIVVINPEYEEVQIPNQDKAVFVLKRDGKYSAVNEKNEQIFKNYASVTAIDGVSSRGEKIYNNTVLKIEENGKFGLIDFDGKEILKPTYDEMKSLEDKYGEIKVKKDGKYGVINVKGIELVPAKYDAIKGDAYSRDGSFKTGGYIIGIKTSKGMMYGYMDRTAKEVIKSEQETLYRVTEIDSNDAYLVASQNGRYAVYKNKENLTDYKYINIYYNNGTETFTVQKNKKFGLINLDGNVIIDAEYDELLVVGIYAKASKEGKNYTFDLKGNEVKNAKFASLQETSTGKFYISIDDNYRYGVANKEQEVVIENKYDYIDEVENTGLLIATVGTDITIYSGSANEILSLEKAELTFIGEYIKVDTGEELYYLTIDGKKVDNKTVFLENQIYASKDESGKWGLVDLKDNIVVDYIYDEVTEINEYGFAGIKVDGKWGIINKNGDVILEPTYESNEINPIFIGKYCMKKGVARNSI